MLRAPSISVNPRSGRVAPHSASRCDQARASTPSAPARPPPRLASRMSPSPERDTLERELRSTPLPVDATVRVGGSVTDPPDDPLLEESEADGHSLAASRDWFQINLPGVGTIEVQGGSDVLLVPDPGCEAADVAPYLEGTVAAVLLAQRGGFALHANAVRVAGSVVAICGPRGAGKSTTSMRLVQRGHALLADDFSPLRFTEAEVLLEGTGRRPRVTPETVAKLGLDLPSSTPQRVDGKLVLPKLQRVRERLDLIVDLSAGRSLPGGRGHELEGPQGARRDRAKHLPDKRYAGALEGPAAAVGGEGFSRRPGRWASSPRGCPLGR